MVPVSIYDARSAVQRAVAALRRALGREVAGEDTVQHSTVGTGVRVLSLGAQLVVGNRPKAVDEMVHLDTLRTAEPAGE